MIHCFIVRLKFKKRSKTAARSGNTLYERHVNVNAGINLQINPQKIEVSGDEK